MSKTIPASPDAATVRLPERLSLHSYSDRTELEGHSGGAENKNRHHHGGLGKIYNLPVAREIVHRWNAFEAMRDALEKSQAALAGINKADVNTQSRNQIAFALVDARAALQLAGGGK